MVHNVIGNCVSLIGREGIKDGTDIADLTWEQREQVLRLMFSKMNSRVQRGRGSRPVRSASPSSSSRAPHGVPSDVPALPDHKYVLFTPVVL